MFSFHLSSSWKKRSQNVFLFCVVKVRLNNSFLHGGLLFFRICVHKIFRFFLFQTVKKDGFRYTAGLFANVKCGRLFYAKSIDLDSKYSLVGDFENSSQTRDSSKSSQFINNYSRVFIETEQKRKEKTKLLFAFIRLFFFYKGNHRTCAGCLIST